MRLLRLHRAGLMAAWALLAGLGLMTLDGYLPHTDDGCSVEIHCVVCSVHLGTAAVVSTSPALPQEFGLVGFVFASADSRLRDFTVRVSAARGPPLV